MNKDFTILLTSLCGYSPKDRHFTSQEEINRISSSLMLNNFNSSELQQLRNFVVEFYENYDITWEGMLSITSVIDYFMYS